MGTASLPHPRGACHPKPEREYDRYYSDTLLAAKAGIDIKALYDVVRVSGGNSRVFEGVVPSVCKRDFAVSFEIRLAHKDMVYVSSLGREMNMPLPMVNSLLNVLDLAKATGLGRENTNALVKLWEKASNVEVRHAWE